MHVVRDTPRLVQGSVHARVDSAVFCRSRDLIIAVPLPRLEVERERDDGKPHHGAAVLCCDSVSIVRKEKPSRAEHNGRPPAGRHLAVEERSLLAPAEEL